MKKILILIILTVPHFISCKKGDNNNSVGTSFTVKYELTTTVSTVGNPGMTLSYTNATGQTEQVTVNTPTKSWTKTITVTSETRPFLLSFIGGSALASPGNMTATIYVNGIVKANSTSPASGTALAGSFVLSHFIQ